MIHSSNDTKLQCLFRNVGDLMKQGLNHVCLSVCLSYRGNNLGADNGGNQKGDRFACVGNKTDTFNW